MNNFRVYNIDHYNYLLHQISNFPMVQSNELNLMLATFPRPVPSRLSLNWPLVKSGSRREELIPVVNFSVTYVTWGAHGFPPFPSSSIQFHPFSSNKGMISSSSIHFHWSFHPGPTWSWSKEAHIQGPGRDPGGALSGRLETQEPSKELTHCWTKNGGMPPQTILKPY